MNIGLNNFVSGGADEALLKSLAADERYQDNEELAKALKKEGLVQVQTTVNGKHGTYTRMQWKRASDVKSTDRVVGQQKPTGQSEGHQAEKPQAARLQNFKVDKTTTPATATFEFKGKKYTATEGKNLTLNVQTTGGGQGKISGKLKLTDGGYPRIGSYPVEGLDNILSVSAKEDSGEGKEAPKAKNSGADKYGYTNGHRPYDIGPGINMRTGKKYSQEEIDAFQTKRAQTLKKVDELMDKYGKDQVVDKVLGGTLKRHGPGSDEHNAHNVAGMIENLGLEKVQSMLNPSSSSSSGKLSETKSSEGSKKPSKEKEKSKKKTEAQEKISKMSVVDKNRLLMRYALDNSYDWKSPEECMPMGDGYLMSTEYGEIGLYDRDGEQIGSPSYEEILEHIVSQGYKPERETSDEDIDSCLSEMSYFHDDKRGQTRWGA